MPRNPIWKAMVAQGLCNGVGISHGAGYLWLVAPNLEPAFVEHVYQWLIGSSVVVYMLLPFAMLALGRPIARALDDDALTPGLSSEVLEAARRRAISLPVLFAGMSVVVWALSALSFLPWAAVIGLSDRNLLWRVVLETIAVGVISSTFVHYAVEIVVRRTYLPALLTGAGAQRVTPGAWQLSVSGKLGVLVLVSAVLPAVSLAQLSFDPISTPSLVIYFGATFVVLAVGQGWLISRSVLTPLGEVEAAQRRVQRQDLTAQVPVRSVDQVGRLAEGFNDMVAGLRAAETIKSTFGVYVHPRLVEELLAGKVALGGELRQATVLFADIRGFTQMSEALAPAEVVQFLNRYLDLMVGAITDHGGTVDKFIGDGIMAAFGAPLALDQTELHATRAALAMIDRLKELNAERAAAGQPPVAIGIGLHTGEVVAGSIGSSRKMQYTLIGDTVNTAARVEELTKHFGVQLLATEATWASLSGKALGRQLPPATVRGKSQPIQVYEVTGLSE